MWTMGEVFIRYGFGWWDVDCEKIGSAASIHRHNIEKGAMKKVDNIRQMMRLKLRWNWKHVTHRRYPSDPTCNWGTVPSSGFLGVYVGIGAERNRFVIPSRFLNLPVFVGLLNKSEEEFGYQSNGGLVLPCDVGFFTEIVKRLKKDEHRYGKFSLDEFVKMFSEVASYDSCKETVIAFTPLLQKAY